MLLKDVRSDSGYNHKIIQFYPGLLNLGQSLEILMQVKSSLLTIYTARMGKEVVWAISSMLIISIFLHCFVKEDLSKRFPFVTKAAESGTVLYQIN